MRGSGTSSWAALQDLLAMAWPPLDERCWLTPSPLPRPPSSTLPVPLMAACQAGFWGVGHTCRKASALAMARVISSTACREYDLS